MCCWPGRDSCALVLPREKGAYGIELSVEELQALLLPGDADGCWPGVGVGYERGRVVDGQFGHRVEIPLRAADSLIRRGGYFGRIGRAGCTDDGVGVEVDDDGDDGRRADV